MATLPRVRDALRRAHGTLPNREAITDLSYLVDVDPYGSESLVVYITASNKHPLDPSTKRRVEATLRDALSKALAYSAYFRWQTEDEVMQSQRVVTKSGLIDQPHSALR